MGSVGGGIYTYVPGTSGAPPSVNGRRYTLVGAGWVGGAMVRVAEDGGADPLRVSGAACGCL